MNSPTILICNALWYIILGLSCYYRSGKNISGSCFLIIIYAICGISSFLFYQHPVTRLTSYYNPVTIEPYIYYAVVNGLMIYPIWLYDKKSILYVQYAREKPIINIIRSLLPLQTIMYLVLLPFIAKILLSNMGDIRANAVEGASTAQALPPMILRILYVYMGIRTIVTIIAFYAFVFVKSHRRLVTYFFISSSLLTIYISLLFVMRSYILFQVLLLLFLFIIFKHFIPRKIKLYIAWIGGGVTCIIAILMIAISNSRFSNMASFFYYKYAGEMFVNFGGEMWPNLKNTTNGLAYFPLVQRFMGEKSSFSNLKEKWDYIDGLTNIDSHIFYGYAGGLAIEFGFVVTLIIFFILCIILSRPFLHRKILSLPNLLIMGFIAHMMISGAYLFVFQGEWGNMEILFFILAYLYFKRNTSKNNILVEK